MDRYKALDEITDSATNEHGDPLVPLPDAQALVNRAFDAFLGERDQLDDRITDLDEHVQHMATPEACNRALHLVAMLCDPDYDTDLAIGMYGDVLEAAAGHEAHRYAQTA